LLLGNISSFPEAGQNTINIKLKITIAVLKNQGIPFMERDTTVIICKSFCHFFAFILVNNQ
jgi:hypothetical protein